MHALSIQSVSQELNCFRSCLDLSLLFQEDNVGRSMYTTNFIKLLLIRNICLHHQIENIREDFIDPLPRREINHLAAPATEQRGGWKQDTDVGKMYTKNKWIKVRATGRCQQSANSGPLAKSSPITKTSGALTKAEVYTFIVQHFV